MLIGIIKFIVGLILCGVALGLCFLLTLLASHKDEFWDMILYGEEEDENE